MNVAVKSILACAIILTLGHSAYAEYDVNAYCTLVKNGVKLASVEDCQTFYTCFNGKATRGECPASQAFDKNTQNCRPKSDVKCYFGVDQPCIGQTDTFVPVANTCNGYIYCKNSAEAGRGQCPLGQIFHQGACVYGNCNDNVNSGETNKGLNSVCQIMPDNQHFGSTKNCKIWQICTAGTLKQGSCPGEFVFDVNNANCNYESANMCSRVTGVEIQPDPTPSAPCSLAQKNNQQADVSKCSSYQECDGTYWVNIPCQTGQYYSPADKKCLPRQSATPVSTCNRCEFTKRQFVNAVDPTCRKYFVCSNGVAQGQGACNADSYFDEGTQACVLDRNGLTNYAKTNGACKTVEVPIVCKDVCSALSGAKCVKSGDCLCGLNASDKCEVCANGIDETTKKCKTESNDQCDEICDALGKDNCAPVSNPEGTCKCGLDGNNCVECAADDTVDPTSKECKACDVYCEGLTTCEENDDCACGLDDADECTLCPAEVRADKYCEVDCSVECAKITNLDDCKEAGACSCGIDDGVCVDCDGDECNKCICAGATPACPADADCECYEDEDGKCISCPDGIDDTDPAELKCVE